MLEYPCQEWPSGSEGKSLYGDSYENKTGFGHEEWLLDDSRIYESDSYHYAFLKPMNVDSGKHIGMEYDIHLFTNISLQAESSRLIELIIDS